MWNRATAAAALCALALLLAGCPNTIRGAGQDIHNSGSAVHDATH